MEPLLSVQNLETTFKTPSGLVPAVKNVNFELHPGKTFALLGESGSGKSITALSILQLLPSQAFFSKDSRILFQGTDLLLLSEKKMRSVRGREIAMIFQEPMTSLNPVVTIGNQIEESFKIHTGMSKNSRKLETLQLLSAVRIQDPNRIYSAFPHQLSGGMKQRAMIAMALALKPKLLICDEPTTALDVTTQAEILKLLKLLQQEIGMSMLFITHDIRVAHSIADEVGIMQAGTLVEKGNIKEVMLHPKHPFTEKLLNASPTRKKPVPPTDGEEVLKVSDLKIYFPIQTGLFKKTSGYVKAVDSVSLSIQTGETLALVGETGCGKTTLGKAIMCLLKPSNGDIVLIHQPLMGLSLSQIRHLRSEFQMVFQDPFGAMDPRMRIYDILEEGMLALHIGGDAMERKDRIAECLRQVGLDPECQTRYPHQFSGGQRQRICIARALSVGPRLMVLDEPTSSLDRTVQAQILDLLLELQEEYELSYLFITHDLGVVKTMAHRVIVMQSGKIVEQGKCDDIFNHPQHPYTQTLLKATL